MAEINLCNIEHLSRIRRLGAATDLWMARCEASGLERELPLPAKGYRDPVRACLRLRRIGNTATQHKLSAFAINDGRRYIGMATRQVYSPNPNPLSKFTRSAELSYWHRDIEKARQAVAVGSRIVGSLLEVNSSTGVLDPNANAWMVTLPEDEIKTEVCTQAGLTPVGEPQVYNIGDEVTVPRQLWAMQP